MIERSPEKLLEVIKTLDPEHNPKYQRRDVTGDGIPETFCNVLARDFCDGVQAYIPAMLANDLFDWLKRDSASEHRDGRWSEETPEEAMAAANLGRPVLAIAKIPGHGHVAIVVPKPGASTPHIAQAGATNFIDKPVVWGFGYLRPSYFVHQ